MKRTIFFIIFILSTIASSWAYDFSAVAPTGQTLYYNIIENNTVEVTYPYSSQNKPSGALTIPSTVTKGQSYTVTSIGNSAFSDCNLTSVTIPNSVTSIGERAFRGCIGITSVTIPNSVSSIGKEAFYGCRNITSVTIPNSVTSIGSYAFYECYGLTSVSIGNSVTSISEYTFCKCSGLTTVSIDNSVTSIGNSAFSNCSALTSVTIPNSVTSIGLDAFSACSALTSVTIPNSVDSIWGGAFLSCNNVTSLILGSGLRYIGNSAFANMERLTCITSKAEEAPYVANYNAFKNILSTIPVIIPCDALNEYQYAYGWSQFSNFQPMFYTLDITSADPSRGGVSIITQPTCDNRQAQFRANAYNGFHFDHWSDGNTDNPRYLVLTSDTIISAFFMPDDSPEGITKAAEMDGIVIRTNGTRIMVEGIADETVRLFDCMGRCLLTVRATTNCTLQAPAPGVYMLQVSDHPTQRVVVLR